MIRSRYEFDSNEMKLPFHFYGYIIRQYLNSKSLEFDVFYSSEFDYGVGTNNS